MQGPRAFLAEPLVTVSGVVPCSLFLLLDEPGVVHGAKLADEDGFGFLIELGTECHGSETRDLVTIVKRPLRDSSNIHSTASASNLTRICERSSNGRLKQQQSR